MEMAFDDNNTNRTKKLNSKLNKPTSGAINKMLPQAIELEEAVLGALMLEKDAITDVVDVLRPESFYRPAHQEIYKAITELFKNAEGIDILTVKQKLQSMGKLEFVGGAYIIAELTSKVNSAANIEYHAHLLVQYAMKRDLISVADKMSTAAFEDTTDVFQLLDEMEQALFEIAAGNIRKNVVSMRDIMHQAISELEQKKNKEDGLTGIPSGFTDLDRVTSGWQKSDLIILAARPAMGKTAFVVTVARNAAVEFEVPVAIFSLEMSSVQLVNRLISAEAELESEKIKKGTLLDYEWQQLHTKITPLAQAPIFIDDTPALSVLELRAKARRLKAQHDIQLLIVDYLQLMTAGDIGKGNREQEIAYISRSLKGIAKELEICVIALSQLSRAVETRGGDKKPQLSDLRESGSIEQDADMVCFLYRPEYYGITQDEMGNATTGLGEIIIAKHRNGSLDNVTLRFLGKYTKFVNLNEAYNFGGVESVAEPSSFPTTQIPSEFSGDNVNTITIESKLNKNNKNDDLEENAPF
ncbi:MAG: replicative DNA helicase [Thermonemataceae bacterium]